MTCNNNAVTVQAFSPQIIGSLQSAVFVTSLVPIQQTVPRVECTVVTRIRKQALWSSADKFVTVQNATSFQCMMYI